ncbi:MAG: cation:proton antiporter [Holophagaceae bacterium]|nr:cation:proton antiporter [Holophagaceae bacterium]
MADQGNVHTLSELGVILLMFSIGLEFSLRKLLRAGPSAALVAIIQASFMTWAGYLVGRLLGWGAIESIFAGSAIAISSTMIIARVFANLGVRAPWRAGALRAHRGGSARHRHAHPPHGGGLGLRLSSRPCS